MIQIQSFTLNPFQENTFILHDETHECVIIDPGCYDQREQTMLTQFIEDNGLKPVHLLNTHCHIDHVFGNRFISNTYDLPLATHTLDVPTLNLSVQAAKLYGLNYDTSPEPGVFLEEGEQVSFGNSTLDILFVPGHAPGHIAFVHHEQQFVINGDVLFQNSIGRTDLPGGDFNTLAKSIKDKMFALGDDYTVYCGHGPTTTIGHEKLNNPFVGINSSYAQ